MKRYIYTKREVQIIRTRHPLAISDEEFLCLYHKAYMRDHIKHLFHLADVYPEISERVFSDAFEEQHYHPADYEGAYLYPILCPANRYTKGRIKNMVCYLTGDCGWSNSLFEQLCTTVPHRLVFNYLLNEYVKDYDADALWNLFFLGQQTLSAVLELRRITELDMLVYRAAEYYGRYVSSFCAECGMGDRIGSKRNRRLRLKPHRKVCSKNGVKRIFSGLGVPTSGLEFL